MLAAARDLLRRRHAIAARFLVASRKTADHGGDMNALTEALFRHAERREPTDETPAGGVGERLSLVRFMRSGRLSDEHHARIRHRAGDRLAHHVRAKSARVKRLEMLAELV